MKTIVAFDYAEMSDIAAELVIQKVSKQPTATITLPTGNTPLGMFDRLVTAVEEKRVSFEQCLLFEMDDYFRIPMDDERLLYHWLYRAFIEPTKIPLTRVHRFQTDSIAEQEVQRMTQLLEDAGGLDLAVIGLGPNGHIAYNEPHSQLDQPVQVVTLAAESRMSSIDYLADDAPVPTHGITLGLATIIAAKQIIMLVSGERKANILQEMLTGPVSEALPGTLLRDAPHVTLIADQAAMTASTADHN